MSFGFGKALDVLRDGDAVTRLGWNAPDQCVFLVPGSEIAVAGRTVEYRDRIDLRAVNGEIDTWQPTVNDVLAYDWDYVR